MFDSNKLIANFNSILNAQYKKNVYSNFELIEEQNIGGTCKSHTLKIQGNVRNFSYSLDAKCSVTGGNLNPFDIFNTSVPNITSKNDLTIICPNDDEKIINVFIIEMKSFNVGSAAHQIRSGKNFLEYLLNVHRLNFSQIPYDVKIFGILAKKQRTPTKPTTSTKSRNFIFNSKLHNGYNIPVLEWNVDELLPLTHVIKNMKVREYN